MTATRTAAVSMVRRYLLGPNCRTQFRRTDRGPSIPDGHLPLYLHVPFCRNACPHCPYCKVKYDQRQMTRYMRALAGEIDMLASTCAGRAVPSIYIGGGTPTLADKSLTDTLDQLRQHFAVGNHVAIETTPTECTEAKLAMLRRAGVNLLSVGVQSFDDRLLRAIGRSYGATDVALAVRRAVGCGFDTVNLDLMFALPDQTDDQLDRDIAAAVESGADQLTFYPLFTFPHTLAGRAMGLRRVRMPRLAVRRRQYGLICRRMRECGYGRVSVWGFRRGEGPRYSSVTRKRYVGLGVSGVSHGEDAFTVNTFDVDDYIARVNAGRWPTVWRMDCTNRMRRYHELYWRLYETIVPLAELESYSRSGDRRPQRWMNRACLLGLARRVEDGYQLTQRGAFWVHWLQNYFALDSIDRLWAGGIRRDAPEAIAV